MLLLLLRSVSRGRLAVVDFAVVVVAVAVLAAAVVVVAVTAVGPETEALLQIACHFIATRSQATTSNATEE